MAVINPGDIPINEAQVDGTELARRLERLYAVVHSQNSNPSRPPTITPGGIWVKTIENGLEVMVYDGTQDVKIGSITNGTTQIPDNILALDSSNVKLTGNQSISGVKTFTGNIAANGGVTGNLTGNVAGNVTGSVTGDVTGNVSGNAGTVTNGVYTTGTQTIGGSKTFSSSLSVSGDITASGNVTAYSDERLKKDWQELPIDFVDQLAKVLSGTFERVDTGEIQVGVGAQSLQKVLSSAVHEDKEGTLSVAYGNAALVACVALAKRVIALEEKLNANSQ
jgi:hypothetical protein